IRRIAGGRYDGRRHRERRRNNNNAGSITNRATAPVASKEVANDDPGDHTERKPREGQVKLESIISDESLKEVFHSFYRRELVIALHGSLSLSFNSCPLLSSRSGSEKS